MPRALIAAFLVLTSTLGAQPRGPVEPTWTLEGPTSPVRPGEPFTVTARVTLPEGYYQDARSEFLSFEPLPPAAVTARSSSPPALRDGKASFTRTFSLTRTVSLPEGTPAGSWGLEWSLGWQICRENGVCLLPRTETATLELSVAALPDRAAASPGTFWGFLAAAFLGGLVLNLMPCVFPVLTLKGLGLASSVGLTRRDRRREAWAFAAGGVGALTLLGLVTAAFAALGQRLAWGFSFQDPAFVWVLTLGFWAFTLQLWGVWSWTGSPFSLTAPGRPGWGRSLAGGAFLVVAAAPCTAPLLGPALGFAFAQPPAAIPLFFTAAGLGLVAPVLLLQAFPGWTRWMPKPGPWMAAVERTAGFFLAATVLYLLWVFTRQTTSETVWPALGLLGLAAGALAAWGKSRFGTVLALGLGAAVLAGSAALVLAPPAPKPMALPTSGPDALGWTPFTAGALENARQAGTPVFVDATAAWCATCQVNELAVLDRADVRAAMDRLGILRLRADITRSNPEVERWLASVGRAGLPVYALYPPGKEPVFFPELLTDGNFPGALASKLLP